MSQPSLLDLGWPRCHRLLAYSFNFLFSLLVPCSCWPGEWTLPAIDWSVFGARSGSCVLDLLQSVGVVIGLRAGAALFNG